VFGSARLGGHIYSCMDKTNGAELFYANPSIKKALVSNRGAWAAFGVEFNFPVSHNWVTVSPVDFAIRQHPDGSASIWVGNVDRVYGMQWRVELILRPGSTVLEQRIRLYNQAPFADAITGGTMPRSRVGTTRGSTIRRISARATGLRSLTVGP